MLLSCPLKLCIHELKQAVSELEIAWFMSAVEWLYSFLPSVLPHCQVHKSELRVSLVDLACNLSQCMLSRKEGKIPVAIAYNDHCRTEVCHAFYVR